MWFRQLLMSSFAYVQYFVQNRFWLLLFLLPFIHYFTSFFFICQTVFI